MPSGMKRIFLTALTDVSTSDKDGVGNLRWEGNKLYKYVKLYNDTATVAGANGDMVGYAAETGAENHTVVLDLTDADSKPVPAGMVLATITGTVDTAYYVWIQIKGPATVNQTIAGTPADGDTLMLSTTDKTLTLFLNDDTNETNDGHPCAVANDESAKKVILDCPF